nr:unnamed protein product [Spirometra erinaceieuropaei]
MRLPDCPSHALIRSRLLRENGNFITRNGFKMRKHFFNDKEVGYFKVQKRENAIKNPISDPTMLTDMLKGNILNVMPIRDFLERLRIQVQKILLAGFEDLSDSWLTRKTDRMAKVPADRRRPVPPAATADNQTVVRMAARVQELSSLRRQPAPTPTPVAILALVLEQLALLNTIRRLVPRPVNILNPIPSCSPRKQTSHRIETAALSGLHDPGCAFYTFGGVADERLLVRVAA